MLIEVENLTRAGKPFAHTYSPAEIALDDEELRLLEDVEVRGRATRKGESVRIEGEIRTGIEKSCDRCLRPIAVPIETAFEVGFVPPETETARESPALEAEDLDVAPLEGATIDIDEVVREQILLTVGLRSVCRDDCRGLCPACGANLNEGECGCATVEVDPRWVALEALREK